jgi:predicted nuclease of restriction endonuclease-like (RecB) superfamily
MAKKHRSPPKKDLVPQTRPLALPQGYDAFLRDLKDRIRSTQAKAAVAVNQELILLYWDIGQRILDRQRQEGWGANVINRLAHDLHIAFPDVKGFSPRNLGYMKTFAAAYPDAAFLQQVAAKIPWFHHCLMLNKVKDQAAREWYIRKTIEHGWSRSVLDHHLDTDLYRRQGKGVTNFTRTLPAPQSDLAQQILKDPYNFDFLSLADDAHERHLERGLLEHIRHFLLELGVGFALVGSQIHLEVGGEDFYIDLLFYHLKLRAFIVIDLKTKPFQPEFAGKMNFYLSAVDDLFRHPDDRPSIGIILCKAGNQAVAEYALRDIAKPVGVSSYVTRLVESLPPELQRSLPSVADLEAELKAAEDASPRKKPSRKPKRRPS